MLESTNQLRCSHLQLLLVRLGQARQQAISFGSEFHQDFPSILLTFHALYCPQFLQARDKPNGAVVLDEQARSDFADGRFAMGRKRANHKQRLMLLRLQAMFARNAFAEM